MDNLSTDEKTGLEFLKGKNVTILGDELDDAIFASLSYKEVVDELTENEYFNLSNHLLNLSPKKMLDLGKRLFYDNEYSCRIKITEEIVKVPGFFDKFITIGKTEKNNGNFEGELLKSKQYYINYYSQLGEEDKKMYVNAFDNDDNYETSIVDSSLVTKGIVGYYLVRYGEKALDMWKRNYAQSPENQLSINEEATIILNRLFPYNGLEQ